MRLRHQLSSASIFFSRVDRRGQTPYLRTIEKYWENARIVEPELGFQCDTRSPDVLVQCKHGLTDKSGTPFNFQLAAT